MFENVGRSCDGALNSGIFFFKFGSLRAFNGKYFLKIIFTLFYYKIG